MLTGLLAFLEGLRRRRTVETEVDEELRFHVEMEVEANVRRGMTPADARRVAMRDFGGIDQTREAVGDVRRVPLESLVLDLRYALSRLRRDKAFSSAVVVTMGLVIGLSTAIFSVANAVWLRPLPMRDPASLVAIERPYFPNFPLTTWASVPDYLDWRERAHSFSELAMAGAAAGRELVSPGGRHEERVFFVSSNLFRMLGVSPLLGRTFREGEDRPAAAKVVILAEELWRRAFKSDPSIVGKRITLAPWDGSPASYEVIGVLRRDFQLEYDYEGATGVTLFLPFTDWPAERSDRKSGGVFNRVYGRLRPGVTAEQAQAEMASLCAALKREYPKDRRPPAVKVVPLHQELLGSTRPVAVMFAFAVTAVLLIGCCNVASLLLGRAAARTHEMAIRSALGSRGYRLVQQQLIEVIVLTVGGGVLGLLMAWWATLALLERVPPTLARVSEVSFDGRVLAFVFGVSVVTGLAAGLVPALRTARPQLADALKASRLASDRLDRRKGGYAIVAADVGLVLVLLVVSGLMARSAWRMAALDLGFDPKRLIVAEIGLSKPVWDDSQRWQVVETELVGRLRGLPGVVGATITDLYPFPPFGRVLDTVRLGDGREVQALVSATEADYAAVMKIPILRGRFLTSADVGGARAAVVNAAFAHRFLKGSSLPQRIQVEQDRVEVVGVLGNITEMGSSMDASGRGDVYVFGQSWKGLEASVLPAVYVPRIARRPSTLVIRTAGDTGSVARALPEVLRMVDSAASVRRVTTMEERLARTTANNRFYAIVLGAFSLVALLLAGVGVHGVVAQHSRHRLGEMAIRTALGARPASVLLLLMRQSLTAVLIGVAAGGFVAVAVTRGMRRLLFGVTPEDPWTIGIAAALLVGVAALAVLLPVRRAVRCDPLSVLRME